MAVGYTASFVNQDQVRMHGSSTTENLVPSIEATVVAQIHTHGRALMPTHSQQHLLSATTRPQRQHVAVKLRLLGKLDRRALLAALDRIVARHDILRATFRGATGAPLITIAPAGTGFALLEDDVSDPQEVEQICKDEMLAPFSVTSGPLIRGRLLSVAGDRHCFLLTLHRLVADIPSAWILVRELCTLYSAFAAGRPDPLPAVGVQFAEHALWLRQRASADELDRQLKFWTGHLSVDASGPSPCASHTLRNWTIGRVAMKLPIALTRRLYNLSRQQQVPLFATLLSAWAVLLGRWQAQETLVVATRVANRDLRGSSQSIGPFANTVALRIDLRGDPTVEELLRTTHARITAAQACRDVPFERLLETFEPPVRSALFRLHMTFDDALEPTDAELRLPNLTIEELSVVSTDMPFDLAMSLGLRDAGLLGTLQFARDLFDRDTAERMNKSWVMLLKGMAKHSRRPISRVAMLTSDDRRLVLNGFNATAVPMAQAKPIHVLFEDQVERAPNAVAVMHGAEALTYAELNARANRLARYLRARGVRTDQLAGICLERSFDMTIALLAILKAGAAYLPLDPAYPRERLAFMLQDAAPVLILARRGSRLLPTGPSTAVVDPHDEREDIEQYTTENLPLAELGLDAGHRLYVIYTSGSTGQPKGTEMPHHSMFNLIEWQRGSFPSNEGKRVLQFAALSFDVAFQETFSTLCTGGTLVLLDERVRLDPCALAGLLVQQCVQRIFVPPLLLQSLAEVSESTGVVPTHLEDVITAGEQLRISPQVRSFFAKLPGCRLHNHYGPTESHVVTAFTLSGDPGAWPDLPSIGRPIANTQIYVVDRHLQPVPIGVTGEIHIGGANLARGYLNRPELTQERFIANPFGAWAGARLYRTGDLARWRADGMLEYLGRNDDQVKVRGFRIELAEIEARLAQHQGIKEVAVVAREDAPGEKRLVAYVVRREGSEPAIADLRAYLQSLLPLHMVPGAFVMLDCLPLSPNGKLDRRALPAPDLQAYATRPYQAPQGEHEQLLAALWGNLLRVDRVGRYDNFFELGGHSLLIVKLLGQLHQRGVWLDAHEVYSHPTVAELARTLTRNDANRLEVPPALIPAHCEAITPQMLPLVDLDPQQIAEIVQAVPGGAANIQDIYPLAPLQEGLLFHHLVNGHGGDAYVSPTLLAVPSRERLKQLIAALQAVIDRHDVLRTAILWEHLPRPVQVVCRRAILPVEQITLDVHRDPIEQLRERMTRNLQRLDLRQAPLVRLTVTPDPRGVQWYALLQLHHIIDDDVSLRILVSEIAAHLQGCAQQLPAPLPYRNHVARALGYARTQGPEAFFRSKLGDIDEPTAPFGLLDVQGSSMQIDEAHAVLAPLLARRLRAQARRLNVSAATLLHAAWALVVARTTGRNDVVFGSVLMGRLQADAGAQQIVGMFINTLPLRLKLQGLSMEDLVRQTQCELVELLRHEQASLATAQRCSGVAGSVPLFTAILNYRHDAGDLASDWAAAGGIRVLAQHYRTNYPIALTVDELSETFAFTAHTQRCVDPRRLLGYMQTVTQSLVDALEQARETPALQLQILPESEREQLTQSFNATSTDYPRDQLIHELFEMQAAHRPQSVAVVYQGQSLTYAELNAQANRLARYLIEHGVGPDRMVGICVERSLEMLVGLLAILKAGGAYVPLDPDYPAERIAAILTDAAPGVVLIQERVRENLPQTNAQVVALDRLGTDITHQPSHNLDGRFRGLSSHHLAYVLYTSGSTGQPKGVMIEHRNVLSLWQGLEQIYRQSPGCHRIGVNASFNFDASVKQLIQLLSGRTLVLVPQSMRGDPLRLLAHLDEQHIEGIDCTPSQLTAWIGAGLLETMGHVPSVVLVGGEPIDEHLWEYLARSARTDFYNVYGPTESTVDVSAARLRGDIGAPHIGRPMENRQVYIMDARGQLAPIDVAGEMHIGGAGVARGYLNRPELTAERFIPDPFCGDPHARLYKSGDLARWRADGTIEYLGRNDDQVKIRGFRVEPGDIEAQLARHPQVHAAAIIAHGDHSGEKRLLAYVVPAHASDVDEDVSAEALQAYLGTLLPEHMVPSVFVMMERLPLTPSGKLDRRALPVPALEDYATERYEPPQGETEEGLADIWREVLRVERVGRHDNFFQLGGHSLSAMQMTVRIHSSLALDVPIRLLFKHPTLLQFSAQVDALIDARLRELAASGDKDIEALLERALAATQSAPGSDEGMTLRGPR